MLQKKHLGALLVVGALAWGTALFVRGTDVSWDHLAPFTAALAVQGLAIQIYEHWLWRQGWVPYPVREWFAARPDLRGTWKVELVSDWKDDAGNGVPPIECYMAVKQTACSLKMDLITKESGSSLIAHRVIPPKDGNSYQVAAVYRNEPSIHLRGEASVATNGKRSEIHHGSWLLTIHGEKEVTSMTGNYWTDRGTRGSMTFLKRVPGNYSSFSEAQAALE